MKNVLSVAIVVFSLCTLSLSAFAATQTIEVRGMGSNSSMCEGNTMAWSCVDRTERWAEDNAERDAQYQCYAHQGRVVGMAYCHTTCFPFSVPDDGQFHYVNCNSNCSVRCEIPVN